MTPTCRACGRTLHPGEDAWASEVTVIGPEGARLVTRYTCDDCEAAHAGRPCTCGYDRSPANPEPPNPACPKHAPDAP